MKLFVFILILIFSEAHAQSCRRRIDYRLDKGRGPFVNYQSTNQGEFGTCYAHAAAALYRSMNPSAPQILPESLAMYERSFLGEVRQDLLQTTEDKSETISSGNVEEVLRQAKGKNVCSYRTIDHDSEGVREASLIDRLKDEAAKIETLSRRGSTDYSIGYDSAIHYLAHQIGMKPIISREELRRRCEAQSAQISSSNVQEVNFYQDLNRLKIKLNEINNSFPRQGSTEEKIQHIQVKVRELQQIVNSLNERINGMPPLVKAFGQELIEEKINRIFRLSTELAGASEGRYQERTIGSTRGLARNAIDELNRFLEDPTIGALLQVNTNVSRTPNLDRCDFSNANVNIGYYFPEVVCMGNGLTSEEVSRLSSLFTPLLWSYSEEAAPRSIGIYDLLGMSRQDAFRSRLLQDCREDVTLQFNQEIKTENMGPSLGFLEIIASMVNVNMKKVEEKLSPSRYNRITRELKRSRIRSLRRLGRGLRRKKAFTLSICSNAITGNTDNDSQVYAGGEDSCGNHAITVIGQRCRRGRVEYLILNSQSLNCRIYDEGTTARRFCAENTGKTWIDEGTLSRITYKAQYY